MTRLQRLSVWISVGVLTAILVGVLVIAIVRMPSWSDQVQNEADLPLSLISEGGTRGPAPGTMILYRDGVAVLDGFPVGAASGPERCTAWDGESTYTGVASWTVSRDYDFTIETEQGQVMVSPYHPTFSDIVWYRLALPLCGSDALWYHALLEGP